MTRPWTSYQKHGLFAHHWAQDNPLPRFHWHNEVEIDLLSRGRMVCVIAGQHVTIPPRTLCVFWGGFSHRVVEWEGCEIWSLSIPLAVFLSWPLPRDTFVHSLLHGQVQFEPDRTRWRYDLDLMRRWHNDLDGVHDPKRTEVLLLEVHARMRRISETMGSARVMSNPAAETGRVERMMEYIAQHYSNPKLNVSDIARSAEINETYAMGLFKRSCGISIMQYVNDQRVSHAKRLLATADAKTLSVATDAGFGSLSQFYNVFRQISGQTPRAYARAHWPQPSK